MIGSGLRRSSAFAVGIFVVAVSNLPPSFADDLNYCSIHDPSSNLADISSDAVGRWNRGAAWGIDMMTTGSISTVAASVIIEPGMPSLAHRNVRLLVPAEL